MRNNEIKSLINDNNVEDFVSHLPKMNRRAVAKNLFGSPEFANSVVSYLYNLCNNALDIDNDNAAIEAYRFTLGEISIKLNDPNVSEDTYFKIIDRMTEISEKIEDLHNEAKKHNIQILGGFAATVGLAGGAVINNPKIRKVISNGVKTGLKAASNIVDNIKISSSFCLLFC